MGRRGQTEVAAEGSGRGRATPPLPATKRQRHSAEVVDLTADSPVVVRPTRERTPSAAALAAECRRARQAGEPEAGPSRPPAAAHEETAARGRRAARRRPAAAAEDAELARRLQAREDAASARAAAAAAAAAPARRRRQPSATRRERGGGGGGGAAAAAPRGRGAAAPRAPPPDHGDRWLDGAAEALAEALGGWLAPGAPRSLREGGGLGGAFARLPPGLLPPGALAELAALSQAVAGARAGALPPELLFSDRDFNEADYETLLALDEGVASRRGAAPEAISRVGEVVRAPRGASGGGGGGGDTGGAPRFDDCAICLEAVAAGDRVRRLPCAHAYHARCVDRWLASNARCPTCNASVL